MSTHRLTVNSKTDYGRSTFSAKRILGEVFAMYEEKPASAEQSSQYYNCNYPQTMESMTSEQISEWITYQQARTELDYSVHVTPRTIVF